MGLLSQFKRNDEPPAGPAPAPDAVAQARALARRRLIGAAVLLAIGVIGFPLLFETQPRPVVRMDIPIEIPRKEAAPPLAMPPAVAPAAVEAPAAQASAAARASAVITERDGDQGRELAPTAARPAPVAAAPASRPAPAASSAVDDGARARAILEGQPLPPAAAAAASTAAARVVVQVGAYTDEAMLREVRQKVEKLGLKTYTQVIESDDTRRTRVRVGPFPNRAEADKAAARLKAAGLPTAVLTL